MEKKLMKKRQKKGFTLVELVVVVAIVAVLTSIAVAAFSQMTAASQEATFRANHRTLVSAVVMVYADNNGTLPANTDVAVKVNDYISDPENSTNKGVAALNDKPVDAKYEVTTAGVVTSTWRPKGAAKDLVLTYTP